MDKDRAIMLLNKVALFRGIFINEVTYLEKCLDVKIANHFCQTEERALEIVDVILGDRHITFESKREIFDHLTKKHQPEYYKEHKEDFTLLTTIQTTRNKIAHLIIAVDDESMRRFNKDGTVGFVKFKNKAHVIYFTPDEQNELLQNILKLERWLSIK